jgi:hypothetical protein
MQAGIIPLNAQPNQLDDILCEKQLMIVDI